MTARVTLLDGFAEFWAAYPRKVGRLAAEAKYAAARKKATAEDILAGVERYMRNKPAWQDWAHPSTFLSQGRWLDEYDEPQRQPAIDWFEECKVIHDGSCGLDRSRHHLRKQCDAVRAKESRGHHA